VAEVLFYHLTETTLEEALPGLLERTVQRGWRAVVQAGSDERRDALDSQLWTYRDDSFLAHGVDHEPHAADQPIVLTTGAGNPNEATVRFLVDSAPPPDDLSAYQRVVFLFDGHDSEQLGGARTQWVASKAAGHEVAYWQQTADGRWERKA